MSLSKICPLANSSLHCCLSLCPKGILSNKISASSNWIDLIWFQAGCPQSDFILRFNIRKNWIEKIGPFKLFVVLVPGLLCIFGWKVAIKIHYFLSHKNHQSNSNAIKGVKTNSTLPIVGSSQTCHKTEVRNAFVTKTPYSKIHIQKP